MSRPETNRGTHTLASRGALVGLAVFAAVLTLLVPTASASTASDSSRAHHLRATSQAQRLTVELRALVGELSASHAHRMALARRVVVLSKQREHAVIASLAAHPSTAARLFLPEPVRHALRAVRGAVVESDVKLTGHYRIWHRDDFRDPRQDVYLDQLVTRSGHVYTLDGATRDIATRLTFARLRPSTDLAVSGYALDGNVLVTGLRNTGMRSLASASSAATAATTGPLTTAVIAVNFTDSGTSIDLNAVKANFQGKPGGDVVSYFSEASYGKMTLVPSFFGPYTIAETRAAGCSDSGLLSSVLQAANADIDYTQFRRVVLVLNCPGLGGVASNEGPMSTPDGSITAALVELDPQSALTLYSPVHELSHTLGSFNRHAAYFDCIPQAFVVPTRFDQNCDSSEYGDEFDVLGGGPSHHVSQLDPYHKSVAGWFDASQFPTVTGAGTYTYTLAPYETATTGVLALNIPRGQSGSSFTVEYRQPTGFDTWMGSSATCPGCTVTQGASITLANYHMNGPGGGSDTQAIDTTPGSIGSALYYPLEDARDGALLPGKTFTDAEDGISITTQSTSASGLTVQVTISPAGSCVRGTPTMGAPSPASQTAAPGQTATYSVVVTSTDSAGCVPETFRYKPDTFSNRDLTVRADPDWFTLAPGASATLALSVTSSPSTIDGTYNYSSGAGELDSNSLEASPLSAPYITYQVSSPPDTAAPSAPGSPTASALGSSVVRVSWSASSDNLGVAGYRIVRNDGLVLTSTTTSLIDTYVTPGTAYTYSIAAFDHKNNLSTAVTASVTTPAKSDSLPPTPPVVTATATDRSVTVSWTPSSDNVGVAYYQVQPCIAHPCIVPADARSLTGYDMPTRTRYDLQVLAFDGDGNMSDPSWGKYTVYTAASGTSAPTQPQQFVSTAGVAGHVDLSWKASTDDKGVDHYNIYRNNRRVGSTASTTYSDATIVTSAEYYVQAVDGDGSLSAPSIRTWFIVPSSAGADNPSPTAAISSPASGASVSGTVPIAVTSSDNVGVAKVELYVDGSLKAASTSAPFSFSLDTSSLAAGSHWLFVRAYDAAGNFGTGSVTTVTVGGGSGGDTTPPAVSIASPASGASISGTVPVQASASDNVGVTRAELYVDGSLKSTLTASPWNFSLDTTALAAGSHTLTVKAYDAAANSASAQVGVTTAAAADSTPPTVSITSPANGASVSGTVLVQASASDNVGVAKVQLFVDGTLKTTLTAAPWSFSLDTTALASGSHTLTVKAADAAGNSASAQVAVTTAAAADTTPPTVSITSPANGASVSGAVQVQASASDNVGVAKVQLLVDGTLLTTQTASPWSFSLDTTALASGGHTLTTKAFDAAGNSASAQVSVNAPGPADSIPPVVSINSPASGASVSGTVQVQASASDNVGVTKLELSVDGTLKSTLTVSPWSFDLDTTTLTSGSHTLSLKAYDAVGNMASAQVGVSVVNDTIVPKAPSSLRALISGTTQLAFNWTASTDNVGVVSYVVYRDGVSVGDTTLPNYLDTGLTPGMTHKYQVYALDAAGNTSLASSALSAKTAALSTSSTGTIAGVVYAWTGKVLANAVVTLTGNGLTKSTKTNTRGVYTFSSLPAGDYAITITPPSTYVAPPGTFTNAVAPAVTAVAGSTIVLEQSF